MRTRFMFIADERGGARLKFIIAIAIFAIILYTGYMYVPVAVDAYQFKDTMQNKVDMATAQGYDTVWIKDQLVKIAPDYHVPTDAVITPAVRDNRIEVRVQFARPISFPGY